MKSQAPPGSTLHGYLSKILARSCQDLGKILAKILPRYWQELQMSWQDLIKRAMFPRKLLLQNPIWNEKNLKGSQQKSTFLRIYIVRH